MPPKVVHVRDRVRGAVFIGRPGPFGNPFIIGRHGTREEVIRLYRQMLLKNPRLVAQVRKELRGKDLACFCAPAPCHGDILLEIANTEPPSSASKVPVNGKPKPPTLSAAASLSGEQRE